MISFYQQTSVSYLHLKRYILHILKLEANILSTEDLKFLLKSKILYYII